MKRKVAVLVAGLAGVSSFALATGTAAAATPRQQAAFCQNVLGGEWDWDLPSGGGSHVGECIEVYGDDNDSIAANDAHGELQYVCRSRPGADEGCIIND